MQSTMYVSMCACMHIYTGRYKSYIYRPVKSYMYICAMRQ